MAKKSKASASTSTAENTSALRQILNRIIDLRDRLKAEEAIQGQQERYDSRLERQDEHCHSTMYPLVERAMSECHEMGYTPAESRKFLNAAAESYLQLNQLCTSPDLTAEEEKWMKEFDDCWQKAANEEGPLPSQEDCRRNQILSEKVEKHDAYFQRWMQAWPGGEFFAKLGDYICDYERFLACGAKNTVNAGRGRTQLQQKPSSTKTKRGRPKKTEMTGADVKIVAAICTYHKYPDGPLVMERASARKIAKMANVSTTTVTRFLNSERVDGQDQYQLKCQSVDKLNFFLKRISGDITDEELQKAIENYARMDL